MNLRRFLGILPIREPPKKEIKKEFSYDYFCEGCNLEHTEITVLVEVKNGKNLWLCKKCCEKRGFDYEDYLI